MDVTANDTLQNRLHVESDTGLEVRGSHGGLSSSAKQTERPFREHRRPPHLEDYVCYGTRTHDPSPHDTLLQGSSGTTYPLVNYITCNRFSNTHKAFLAAITKIIEPRYYHEAAKDPH